MTVPPPPVLAAEGLIKEFPGVRALDGVTFAVSAGEVHALCGENGAGKSTLIKTLSGLYPYGSYAGRVLVDGTEAQLHGVADAARAGIAVIYQELALVEDLTVAENIFLGREPQRGGLIDWDRLYGEAAQLLAKHRIPVAAGTRCGDLGTGAQQLVEIAKALSCQSRVLILDEPTAALTETEVQTLLGIVRDLRAAGTAIVYISHRLEEVFAIADRITVLRDGRSVGTLEGAHADRDTLIRMMVGRDIANLHPRRATTPGKIMLEIAGLTVAGPDHRLDDIHLHVRAGEVLGIGGLMGAGRSELLLHLMGAWGRRLGGTVRCAGHDWAPANPGAAIRGGMVLVVEDRKRYGLILDQGVSRNLSLGSLHAVIRHGLIDADSEYTRNATMATALRVKAANLDVEVGTLSGGNQQKVLIGKALLTDPQVVLLDEPTRGIDVGAKQEVYEIINRLTAEGHAVIMVSSELPELLGMSDRILMLAGGGRVGGEFAHGEVTQEQLLAAALPTTNLTGVSP
ncbi:MAG: sugar ABC transporter ATP-binding protein [Phycisphaerae bacterium]